MGQPPARRHPPPAAVKLVVRAVIKRKEVPCSRLSAALSADATRTTDWRRFSRLFVPEKTSLKSIAELATPQIFECHGSLGWKIDRALDQIQEIDPP